MHWQSTGVDPEVAHLYNPLHPAILTMLSMTIWAADKANIPVSICGEMAGDAHLTRLLLGMGLREFSMHPAQLLNVKQEILSSNMKLLKPKVDKVLSLVEEAAIEEAVQHYSLKNCRSKLKKVFIQKNSMSLFVCRFDDMK